MIPFRSKRKNSFFFYGVILLFLLCQSPLLSQNHGSSKNSKKDLEGKKKRINEEIREINSMLNETKASKKNLIGALVNINIKLEKRQDLINTIVAEIRV